MLSAHLLQLCNICKGINLLPPEQDLTIRLGLSQAAEHAARSPPWSLLTSAHAHAMTCMLSWCPLFPRAGNPSHIWPQPIHPPKMARSAALTLVLPHLDFQVISCTFSPSKLSKGFHWVPSVTPFSPHSRLY